jgi:hypothetical protein
MAEIAHFYPTKDILKKDLLLLICSFAQDLSQKDSELDSERLATQTAIAATEAVNIELYQLRLVIKDSFHH